MALTYENSFAHMGTAPQLSMEKRNLTIHLTANSFVRSNGLKKWALK